MNKKHTPHGNMPCELPNPLVFNGYEWEMDHFNDDGRYPHIEPYHGFYYEPNEPKYSMKHAILATIAAAFLFVFIFLLFLATISIINYND